jgi:hypothetical protein
MLRQIAELLDTAVTPCAALSCGHRTTPVHIWHWVPPVSLIQYAAAAALGLVDVTHKQHDGISNSLSAAPPGAEALLWPEAGAAYAALLASSNAV